MLTKKDYMLAVNLAKIFDNYDFFNDHLAVSESYDVLLEVFSVLPSEMAAMVRSFCVSDEDGD